MRGDGVLFIGQAHGLVCVKFWVYLCKKMEVTVVVCAGVTGYHDLGNQLPIRKLTLEVC